MHYLKRLFNKPRLWLSALAAAIFLLISVYAEKHVSPVLEANQWKCRSPGARCDRALAHEPSIKKRIWYIAPASPLDSGLAMELLPADFSSLASRADKGDPKSTCVISALIRTCSSMSSERWPDYWLEQAAESEPKSDKELKAVDKILHLQSLAERKLQLCKNLQKSQLDQSGRRKLQAARAHIPGAAAEFFSRPKLVNSAGEVDTALAKAYQYEAPFLLETAAMQGDPDALFWLFHLLTNGHFTVRGGVEVRINVDKGKALVVGQRLLLVADEDTVESVRAELSKLTTSLTEADIKHAAAIEEKFMTPTQKTNFHGLPEHPLERMDRCNVEYG